jgi:hypothetical protein
MGWFDRQFWANLRLHYREFGVLIYIGAIGLLAMGLFGLDFYLDHMIHVPPMIENRVDFVKIRNDNYAGLGGILLVGLFPAFPFVIKTWHIKRGKGVGKRYYQMLMLLTVVGGVASKLWIDHLLVEAGYHKCAKHEIHLNPKGNMEIKFRPRAWVLDPGDCIKP